MNPPKSLSGYTSDSDTLCYTYSQSTSIYPLKRAETGSVSLHPQFHGEISDVLLLKSRLEVSSRSRDQERRAALTAMEDPKALKDFCEALKFLSPSISIPKLDGKFMEIHYQRRFSPSVSGNMNGPSAANQQKTNIWCEL